MQNSIQTDVTIIGGGLTGPLLALALASGGIRSAILDRQNLTHLKTQQISGKGYAIALSSRRLLETLDLWLAMSNKAYPISDILVSDGRVTEGARSSFLHFDHQDIGTEPFGHMIEDCTLRPVILQAVQDNEHITYYDNSALAHMSAQDTHVEITTNNNNTRFLSKLVVGCDGYTSHVATQAGIKKTSKQYDQRGLVCTIRHTKPHYHIAHEYFLPGGPFAILPLSENTSTLVWTERTRLANTIQSACDSTYIQALQDRMGDVLGNVVGLSGPRWSYPLRLSIAHTLYKPRIALAGDAAHVIHPIAGQGLNIGIRDIAALSQVLVEAARRGEDIGAASVLERYHTWRHPEITTLALATDGLNTLFSNDIEPVRLVRDLGLAVFNKVPFLRKTAMRFAAGLGNSQPNLLKGRPL